MLAYYFLIKKHILNYCTLIVIFMQDYYQTIYNFI